MRTSIKVTVCGCENSDCSTIVEVDVELTLKTDREGYSKGRFVIRENDVVEALETQHGWRPSPARPYGKRYCPVCAAMP